MTVVADEKCSVALPGAKPGDRYEVENAAEGKLLLTKVSSDGLSGKPKVQFVRENGLLVGVLGRPIDEEALAKALREFP